MKSSEGLLNGVCGIGELIFEVAGGLVLLVVTEEVECGLRDIEAGQEFALGVDVAGLCGDLHGRGRVGWLGKRTLGHRSV